MNDRQADDHVGLGLGVPARAPQWVTPGGVAWVVLSLLCVSAGVTMLFVPPLYVILVAGGLVGGVLLFFYPFLGVLAYLVFEYARLSAMYGVFQSLQLGKVLVASTLLAWILSGLMRRRFDLVRDRCTPLLGLWVIVAFASCLPAVNTSVALSAAADLAKWVLVYFVFIQLVDSTPKWNWFVWTLVLLNLKLSQFQLRNYILGLQMAGSSREYYIQQGVGAGTTSFLANATDFGAAMVIVAPFALYLIRAARPNWLKPLAVIAVGSFCLSILRSGSRGAALALFAMAVAYWWRSRQKLAVALTVVGLAAVFWVIAPAEWKERFIAAKNVSQDATASSRLDFWKAGLGMFVRHPALGVGIYNFGPNYLAGGGDRAIVPHNIFIQAAAELGLPGLILVVSLIYLVFKRNRQTRRLCALKDGTSLFLTEMSLAIDVSMIGFLVSGFFLSILYYPHLFVLLAMSVSLHSVAKKKAASRAAVHSDANQPTPNLRAQVALESS